jgi:hypothetical protein
MVARNPTPRQATALITHGQPRVCIHFDHHHANAGALGVGIQEAIMMCMPQCLQGAGMPWDDAAVPPTPTRPEEYDDDYGASAAASEAEAAAFEAAQFNPSPWLEKLTPRTAFRAREKPYVPPEPQPYLRAG